LGFVANLAWGLGFELGESKDQLKLKYDLTMVDHGTDRGVSLVLSVPCPRNFPAADVSGS